MTKETQKLTENPVPVNSDEIVNPTLEQLVAEYNEIKTEQAKLSDKESKVLRRLQAKFADYNNIHDTIFPKIESAIPQNVEEFKNTIIDTVKSKAVTFDASNAIQFFVKWIVPVLVAALIVILGKSFNIHF